MTPLFVNFLMGLAVSAMIAYLAYRARSLNANGALAAGLLGTIVFGLGGAGWALVLLTFFISSSGLSLIFKSRKVVVNRDFAKGSRRDAWQVAANGGAAGLMTLTFVFVSWVAPDNVLLPALWIGFAASLAAANADTWATELGVLNPRRPVLLTSFRRVPQGTSGSVSLVGTLAAGAGSASVAGVAVLCSVLGIAPSGALGSGGMLTVITLGGVVGALVDSLLGATLQAIYYCPACKKETERHPHHSCGAETTLARGQLWLTNDGVNALCTLNAALVGVIAILLLG